MWALVESELRYNKFIIITGITTLAAIIVTLEVQLRVYDRIQYWDTIYIFAVSIHLFVAISYLYLFNRANRYYLYAILPLPINKVINAHIVSYLMIWIFFVSLSNIIFTIGRVDVVAFNYYGLVGVFSILALISMYWLLIASVLLLLSTLRGTVLVLGFYLCFVIVYGSIPYYLGNYGTPNMIDETVALLVGGFTEFQWAQMFMIVAIVLIVLYQRFSLMRRSFNRFFAW